QTTAPGPARNGPCAGSRRTDDSHRRKYPIPRALLAVDYFCGPLRLPGRPASCIGTQEKPRTETVMIDALAIFAQPEAWAALATLIVLEVVLGIDNLIFISILSNKLPAADRTRVRRLGISLALVMRIVLLSGIAWLVGLTAPVFDLGIQGAPGAHGEPGFETSFSWRDLILIAGGLFLIWKATKEIHHNVDPGPDDDVFDTSKAVLGVGAAIVQILL